MADRISVRNIAAYAYHGVHEAEKRMGQRFEVDVDLYLDLREAGQSDDLSRTVNYGEVYRLVHRTVVEQRYDLIEALAEAIAAALLASYARIESVTVRVRKPHAPLGGVFDTVEVEITRARTEH
ncbi:MAG TPA: dihydroneopterin aldolase [Limnochordia bacterium]